MKKVFLGLIGIAVFTVCVYGQDANSPHVVKMATTKFMTLPMLPACLQLAAQEGDPMKGSCEPVTQDVGGMFSAMALAHRE